MITFALKFNKDAGPVEGINSLAIFLIIATLGFVVFFALGPGKVAFKFFLVYLKAKNDMF